MRGRSHITNYIDECYEMFNVGDEFLSEYHSTRNVDQNILQDNGLHKNHTMAEEDEIIAFAANSNEGITIEVYERRPCDKFSDNEINTVLREKDL